MTSMDTTSNLVDQTMAETFMKSTRQQVMNQISTIPILSFSIWTNWIDSKIYGNSAYMNKSKMEELDTDILKQMP